MRNSENFGVQELNTKEMEDIDGGIIWFIVIAALLYSTSAY